MRQVFELMKTNAELKELLFGMSVLYALTKSSPSFTVGLEKPSNIYRFLYRDTRLASLNSQTVTIDDEEFKEFIKSYADDYLHMTSLACNLKDYLALTKTGEVVRKTIVINDDVVSCCVAKNEDLKPFGVYFNSAAVLLVDSHMEMPVLHPEFDFRRLLS